MDGWGRAAVDDTALPSFLGRFSFLIDKIIQKIKLYSSNIKKGEAEGLPDFILG
jgi:hypothetical protein